MAYGPKPKLDETRFIPRTLADQRWLLIALIESGTGPAQARRIVDVLQNLPERRSKAFSVSMCAYRNRLVLVGAPPWEDGETSSRSSDRTTDRDLVAA